MTIPDYTDPAFRLAAGDSWHPGGTALTKRGLEACRFSEHAAILDIGCGMGETLKLLHSFKLDAVGLDKEKHAGIGAPFVEGDASALPFASASFDGIVCECVLSLLPSPDAALASFCRVLKPGGRILLSDIYLSEHSAPSSLPRTAPASCIEGAMTRSQTEGCMATAGLNVIFFEDHPEALKELAAKLIWYGGMPLKSLCLASDCGKRYGYGMWIAEKMTHQTHLSPQIKELP